MSGVEKDEEEVPKSGIKSGVKSGAAEEGAAAEESAPTTAAVGSKDGTEAEESSPIVAKSNKVEQGSAGPADEAESVGASAPPTAADERPKSKLEDGEAKPRGSQIVEQKSGKEKSGGIQKTGSLVGAAPVIKSELKATASKKSTVSEGGTGAGHRRQSSAGSSGGARRAGRSRSTAVTDVADCKIGFVGAGRMTESIVRGLLKVGKAKPKQMYVSARTSKNLDSFKVQGVSITTRSYDIFGRFDCDVVFLCVHGYVVRNCFKLGGTRPAALTTNYIPTRRRPIFLLSLIGGIPLSDVKMTLLNPETSAKYKLEMHRLVLNTSVGYGLGLGALDVELDSKKCHALIRDLVQSIARVEHICADLMDSACALMGNGLAFIYYFISALADGGFKMGLSKLTATKLATKTLQCATLCLLESNKNPIELRDQCTSPSGPAIYGLAVLDKQDCASGIQAAVEASYRRIKELAELSPDALTK